MNKHSDLKRDTIKRISIKTFSDAYCLRGPRPRTMESASYNIPFLIGAAVINGAVGPDQIAESRLSDPNILSVADKVEVIHDSKFDTYFPKMTVSEIEIESTSGIRYKTRVGRPRGDAQNPMSDKELTDKFKSLATRSISLEASEKVIETVKMLEKLSNVNELTNIFQDKGREVE